MHCIKGIVFKIKNISVQINFVENLASNVHLNESLNEFFF